MRVLLLATLIGAAMMFSAGALEAHSVPAPAVAAGSN